GPDVKSPPAAWRNIPESPDTLPLVVSMIGHVVLADVSFGPPAVPILNLVPASDQKRSDQVAAFARHDGLSKAQLELHLVPAGEVSHEEETTPRARREPRVRLRLYFGIRRKRETGADHRRVHRLGL